MEGSLGVRKGAWSKEEDDLLRACINRYGEGKWHLVPQRSGLKRCRKSCRLRWLNHLKPNIKRGEFAEDEIDMISRMHKLLGKRWSLIAGRLPGRTANDVKNFWYSNVSKNQKTKIWWPSRAIISKIRTSTDFSPPNKNFFQDPNPYSLTNKIHLRSACFPLDQRLTGYVGKSKTSSRKDEKNQKPKETAKTHEVIKPQARTFSKNSPWLKGKLPIATSNQHEIANHSSASSSSSSSHVPVVSGAAASAQSLENWWETMLENLGRKEEDITCCLRGLDRNFINDLWDDSEFTEMATKDNEFLTKDPIGWSDFHPL